jgi:HEAT repeats
MKPATGVILLATLLLLLLPDSAVGQELDMDEVNRVAEKGKDLYQQAMNPDLSNSEKNKLRKEAYQLLNQAYGILDKWCDDHQEDAERFDDLMVELAQMRYWLRKDSPVGLLEKDDSNVNKATRPDWGEKPKDLDQPAPEPGGQPVAPAPRKTPLAEHMEFAAKYEKQHRSDLAGIRDIYLDILEHAEPGTEEYEKAIARVSELNAKLKDWYRREMGQDPDALALSGSEERRCVHGLSKDLPSSDRDIRLRAARYLGQLHSGDGGRHLVKQLTREKDAEVRNEILNALTKIGGAKVCKELGKLGSSRDADLQMEAIAVLTTLAGRSTVEGKYAGLAMSQFVTAKSDLVGTEAINNLAAMGANGVDGLIEAVQVKNHDRRLRVIEALGNTGDGRAAGGLGAFLIMGVKGKGREYRDAAEAGLKKIGHPVVPYLARYMGNPRARVYVKYVLRQITNENFKTAEAALAWWERQPK